MQAATTKGHSDRYKLPDPDRATSDFCLSRWYHYLSIGQINPLIPKPTHFATDNRSYHLVASFFKQSALTRRPESFFSLDPNPLSASLHEGMNMDFVHNSMYYETRYRMEVSGLRHVQAALSSTMEGDYPSNRRLSRPQSPILFRKNISCIYRDSNPEWFSP
jgi:hypothetical protein